MIVITFVIIAYFLIVFNNYYKIFIFIPKNA